MGAEVPTLEPLSKYQGVPLAPVVERQVAKAPDDPSRWFLNTVEDLGIVSARALQGLTSPTNVALIAAMSSGNEEAAIPMLAKLGFSASMAKDAVESVSKGVAEAKKGNLREAGRLFSGAAVNGLLIALGARKGLKGFSYRRLEAEPPTARLQGEVATPKPKTSDVPLPTVQDAVPVESRPVPPPPRELSSHEEALRAVEADQRPGIPVPPPPVDIIHPAPIKAEGKSVSVTTDDIRAYVDAASGKAPMKVTGPDGEAQDLASGSEADRIREVKLPRALHEELFPGGKFRPGMTVGEAVDQRKERAAALQPVPPPPGPQSTVENKPVAETPSKHPVPAPPTLELKPTPPAKPVPEPGWKMSLGSYKSAQAEKYKKAWAPSTDGIRLVPDPRDKIRYWVSYKPKETPKLAPTKALGPAPTEPVPPPPLPKWEWDDDARVDRLKDLTGQMIALMEAGKDIPPELEAEHGRLHQRMVEHDEYVAENARKAEIEAQKKPVAQSLVPVAERPQASQPAQPYIPPPPSPEEKARLEVLRSGTGADWVGLQESPGEEPRALFTDPKTRSTLSLPVGELSKDRISKVLEDSRAKYNAARNTDSPLDVGPPKKFIFERAGFMYAGKRKIPVEYGYMENADVVASHDPVTFTKNPDHPGQQRYSYEVDKEQQADLERMFMNPEVERTLADSISPLEGPPMVIADGSAAGGNKRDFWIQKMYGSKEPYAPLGGVSRAKYLRDAVVKAAQNNGTAGVEEMKEPVRVRRIAAPETMGEWMDLTGILNSSPSAPTKPGERAMFYASRISPSTVSAIAGALQELNPDASIREFMSAYPVDFVRWLQESGAIGPEERLAYMDPKTGGLNDDGKTLFESALLAKVLNDARLIDTAPQQVVGKLASSLGPILRIGVRGGQWDIRPLLMQAAEVAGEAQKEGVPLKTFLDQMPMFESGPGARPAIPKAVKALAEFLDRKTPLVKKGIRQFAAESEVKSGKAQGSFITEEPDPVDSFKAAFTAPIDEPEPPPRRMKNGKMKTESPKDKAKRLAENEESKRRMGRYQLTREEYEEALTDGFEAQRRANKEKFAVRPEN